MDEQRFAPGSLRSIQEAGDQTWNSCATGVLSRSAINRPGNGRHDYNSAATHPLEVLMFVVRETFRAKPGSASKLAALFKSMFNELPQFTSRVMTDYIAE